jgi:MFS superfamily sulfate permease-like transporter
LVLIVLLLLTGPRLLPDAALAAVVFLIAIELITSGDAAHPGL